MDDFFLDGMPPVFFGRKKFQEAGAIISESGKFGKKAFIVTGYVFASRSHATARLVESLAAAGIGSVVYPCISPNPAASEIDSGAKSFIENGCDFTIGLGGGSPIDAAKAIAACAACKRPVWEFIDSWNGKQPSQVERAFPIVAIPTRFGSGAEVSAFSVVTNAYSFEKSVFASAHIMPSLAIIDPDFGATLSDMDIAAGAADALSHLLETYFTGSPSSPVADSLTECLAEELIRCAATKIFGAGDGSEMDDLFYISALALTGVTHVGRGGDFPLHDIEHPLSARFGVPHGIGLGALMPHLMSFTCSYATSRFARFYRRTIARLQGEMKIFRRFRECGDDEDAAANAVECLAGFLEDIGACIKLSKYGIAEADLAVLADDALRLYAHGEMYLPNPRQLRYSDIMDIYRAAL